MGIPWFRLRRFFVRISNFFERRYVYVSIDIRPRPSCELLTSFCLPMPSERRENTEVLDWITLSFDYVGPIRLRFFSLIKTSSFFI